MAMLRSTPLVYALARDDFSALFTSASRDAGRACAAAFLAALCGRGVTPIRREGQG